MASDDVFDALGDPTRRRILALLTQGGPSTATRLADELAITRQAVAKHLDQLRSAGLTRVDKVGREARHAVVPERLDHAAGWLDARAREWEGRLRRIEAEVARRRVDGPATGA
ncbi:ArsR/SmtB family transcription factor [Actinomarinicola tropica]|uniref:ArsR/SmtB family transcription factor n=1 Tax=Actinomarinicola tropica TaxID=2789776 RepID=UPI001E5E50FA|nr:metalloregulator ArsR/SmtB family transcription factor [Actinomarinicola tropica]